MNINVSIVDQRVRGIASKLQTELEAALGKKLDDPRLRSAAFVFLCVKTVLDLSDEEVFDRLTEGGNDFGVDAIDISSIVDNEFTVNVFQCKYHHKDLSGTANFPETGLEKAVQAVRVLFDPASRVVVNPRLETWVEEIRSRIMDGDFPRVRFFLCGNGQIWQKPKGDDLIKRGIRDVADRVQFEHVNHDDLIEILQRVQPVKDTIQFSGKAIVEDFNFSRVFIGKVLISEIARLLDTHGDKLLERNIRRYLGLYGNRVNTDIRRTIFNDSGNFFFYNNGITLTCKQFDYNALQNGDYKVRVDALQIINGGQTCKTIQETFREIDARLFKDNVEDAYVLVRLYQVPDDTSDLIKNITFATNSQNPVDLRDLRSNDEVQKRIEISLKDLGYEYKRQKGDGGAKPSDITSSAAAEAILAVWRGLPQLAKFKSSEHFGKLYDVIFQPLGNEILGAHVVVAVLLFRIAENKRKHPPENAPTLVRYGSCFSAMLMGQYLLSDLGIQLKDLDHRNFNDARKLIESRGETYFDRSVEALEDALRKLYGEQPLSLQRLSATFRRGDLMEFLGRPATTNQEID